MPSHAIAVAAATPLSSEEHDPAGYRAGYLALRSLMRDRVDPLDSRQLLGASYAVYGWMPTVLKTVGDLDRLGRFIVDTRNSSVEFALGLLRDAAGKPDSVLMSLNRSVVGTSKLLHFFQPNVFPIWDSRIAALFGFRYGRHNRPDAYFHYSEALHRWLRADGQVPEKVVGFIGAGASADDPPSKLRAIEYILFLASPMREVQDR